MGPPKEVSPKRSAASNTSSGEPRVAATLALYRPAGDSRSDGATSGRLRPGP